MHTRNSVFVCTFLGIFASAASLISEEAPSVQKVEVVDFGIYRLELTGQHVPAPSAAAGSIRPATRAVLVAQTNQIPAAHGTSFGIQFVLKGAGAVADVVVVVEHPAFKKPSGEVTGTVDRVPYRYSIGEKVGYTYTFDYDWETVPGTWKIEVWQGDKKLAGKEFTVRRAPK